NHVWNLHGPKAEGASNWVSYYRTFDEEKQIWSASLTPSYFLDPGNPAALDYTTAVYLNVVKNYDVDGIHLDYTRYDGFGWGFNATNVARFNARYGTTGLPEPKDPQWLRWRREQTANLVRKTYLKAIAIKPDIKVSSAVITWGDGPVSEGDWERSRAYNEVGQDWRGWLQEGIIDLVIPMNYFLEWNSTQKSRYGQWIEWQKDHQYGRQIVIGPGLFSNYIEQSLDQIRRAQTPSALGNSAAGVALYAYGWNNLYSNADYHPPTNTRSLPRQPHVFKPESNDWLFKLLSKEGSYLDPVLDKYISTQPVFPAPASIPDMPWKSNPTKGYLMGTILGANGKSYDGLKVKIESLGALEPKIQREVYTDGSSWYGVAELPAGQYRVSFEQSDFNGERQLEVTVQPGLVAEANFQAISK
ncbi:MAG TPA: family 10 glycosylhydrolase, partial [Bacillota bacterium]|nr:family 10 glycosylhydrolase [Bacillota bacterium]